MAHVTRRATDELGDLELAAELRHVKADERVLAAKEVLGERLGELGLARAGGTQEDKAAAGATRVLERRTALATASTASSWPMMRVLSTLSVCSRRRLSLSVSEETGTPEVTDTMSAI